MPRWLLTFSLLCLSFATLARGDELLSADKSIEEAVDHYVGAKQKLLGVQPAPLADDANLLRRTMLDLHGRPPTAAEVKAYQQASDAAKRREMVERLLAAPAFARQQGATFDALLMRGTNASLRNYLTEAFKENRSWDRIFRELLLGQENDPEQKGAIAFVKSRMKDQDKLTAEASSLLFGVNVSCAQCHDHPLVDDWKQDHYFGMKSFFARSFENGDYVGEKPYGMVEFKTTAGESRKAKLMFLTSQVFDEPENKEPDDKEKKAEKELLEKLKKDKKAPPAPEYSRRAKLVEIALAPEANSFFSRAIVNHVWNRLLGRGLVMPVDQMHSANLPSHPELLDWLARDLQAHNYDLARLTRGIVLSDAYARSSQWKSTDKRPSDELFAVGIVRPLTPWQYGTALKVALVNPDQYGADLAGSALDTKAQQLENAGRSFGDKFELPGEDFQVSVDEALSLSNAERTSTELLRVDGGNLLGKLTKLTDDREVATTAVWNIFGREPTAEEVQALESYLQARADRRDDAVKQIVWALLTSSECRFNY
ncbi:hypothetical protein ETAA8_64400 [Anatilimnocola aggregata]|uniref:DUF1553 domain-containing protein n=1 Tax=Anatilimnocola aggregata TaxID=2528021 RepID=A0A517YM37_9BACT|nr:DUF1549 domain-containing protein [Anatilimnocola aggregata]QDU31287.1 hypothetical protein ETAA8_64400 [Anatilimnocola aggregata]